MHSIIVSSLAGRSDWASICIDIVVGSEILALISRLQNLERAHEWVIDSHHCTGIVKLATVVRGAKKCNQLSAGEKFIPIFDHLVSSADKINIMLDSKLTHNLFTKSKTHSTIIVVIFLNAALRVWPEQITEETGIGHIGRPHNVFDLVQDFEFGGKTSVHAENFFVN